ncbi:MAG: hypothetical protein F4Z25_07280 [Chloroflexi bacterium]|nr:hypothetical protein [Gemmatimonadota bacterium]MYA20052.1 hypothetical protein [Chloroflexota bacterium]MYD28003.1 hypothetical protein [Dehalococcoidia bacterium]
MILVLALIVAALSFGCTSDRESTSVPGFYAEVAVEAEPRRGDPHARFGGGGSQVVIRWWYAPDPARWRWEHETVGTIIDDGVLLTVFDGDDWWEHDDRTAAYRRVAGGFARLGAEAMVLPTFSAPVGPTHADTIEALVAQWRERGDDPEVTMAGEATLLGRPTRIVEIRASGGRVARAFVDPERMFIMRWDADGAGGVQSYRAEVTVLDYGVETDKARFAFEPPPGAQEASAEQTGSCGSSGGGYAVGASFPAEPGFLAPAYTPPGYRTLGMGGESSASSCERVAVWALLEAEDGRQMLLRQRLRPGGLPPLDSSWRPVPSGLDEAYRHSGGGVLSLLWRADDVVALLRAETLSLDELVRVAESARLVPRR